MALSCLIMTSCMKPSSNDGQFAVSIRNSVVSSAKGEQFVSVKCAGNWNLFLVSDEEVVDWTELDPISGTGNKSNVRLTYKENTSESARSLKIVLDNGKSMTECVLTQRASGEGQETPPVSGGMDLTKTGWLELPALDDPTLSYYTHSFNMGGTKYRNYSFGWSQNDLVSVWVAYPLCKMYTVKNVDREDAEIWARDPYLGSNSSAPFGGYGGDYDRGHQLPFADRSCCLEAGMQTFYGSNMTPQDHTLNTGIWAAFENKVRTWANSSDTLYVVTGCVVKNPLGYTTDSSNKRMTVPSAYFKALLKYSKASTLGQWNAAGFYYKHESNAQQQMMSIDKLEEMTGLDFFVNLASKLGPDQAARLEAATPNASVWK